MCVVAETVLAAAHQSEEIAPASVNAILCGNENVRTRIYP